MSNTFNVSSDTWNTAGSAASTNEPAAQFSSWEPAPLIKPEETVESNAGRDAFARLRTAIQLAQTAAAQKEAALEEIKTLVASQAISPDAENKPGSFTGLGVRVNRVVSPKWEQSTKAKERLAELTGDLRQAGEITKTETVKWSARLI